MSSSGQLPESTRQKLKRPLGLTLAGIWAERITLAFWPLWSVLFVCLAVLLLGLLDTVSVEFAWVALITAAAAICGAAVWGVVTFRKPTRDDALIRVDETLPERPLAALQDRQAIGATDAASQAVWSAHIERMTQKANGAKAVQPDLRVSRHDPFALRYVALLFMAVAVLFGSLWRVSSVSALVPQSSEIVATGPVWEGWIEPPAYTGKPTLYLNDLDTKELYLPEGSEIVLRLYGEVGALTVTETVSGRTDLSDIGSASAAEQSFEIVQDGSMSIEGIGGQRWDITAIADQAPTIELLEAIEAEADGEISQMFEVFDDYGVVSGTVTIALDLDAVDRLHGLAVAPDPREELVLELPMPFAGDRSDFTQSFVENLSTHAFANLPTVMTYRVVDDAGLEGATEPEHVILPGRRFFDPLAKAIIEQRRDLMWSRENASRVSQILRAVSHRPNDIFRSETSYLRLRVILRRLEAMTAYGLKPAQQDEIVQALWELAVQLEEGTLSDAYERLKRAQDQLAEAMKNGASDEEIAALMDELREAMDDYMRQLAQQNSQDGQDQQNADQQQGTEVTQDQLQALMDEIERLMQEGQMAEAQALMEQLNQMMENMQVQQGGQGQSPSEQAMEGLADTLENQQGLSDQAFRDLQEQFNPNAQAGENAGNEGRNGGQGEGQSHEGQQGQGEGDEGGGDQGDLSQNLADRQRALRQSLEQQQRNLAEGGATSDEATSDALDRAGDAMDRAEDALRNDQLADAIDNQAEAIEALREGMRALAEEMAENQRNSAGQGTQSDQAGRQQGQRNQDPLGRDQGTTGDVNSGENVLTDQDVYKRARELLDEIRKRSSEGERPEIERDYLKRLLDRF